MRNIAFAMNAEKQWVKETLSTARGILENREVLWKVSKNTDTEKTTQVVHSLRSYWKNIRQMLIEK